jgi:hypothetical protein
VWIPIQRDPRGHAFEPYIWTLTKLQPSSCSGNTGGRTGRDRSALGRELHVVMVQK